MRWGGARNCEMWCNSPLTVLNREQSNHARCDNSHHVYGEGAKNICICWFYIHFANFPCCVILYYFLKMFICVLCITLYFLSLPPMCLIGTKIALYQGPCALLFHCQFIVDCWERPTDSVIYTYMQYESAPRRRSILIASWWWSAEDVINTSKAPYDT